MTIAKQEVYNQTINMITRQQYLQNSGMDNHRIYYSQFVNDEVKQRVLRFFDIETLKKSFAKDEYFNDKLTPMKAWDLMGGFIWKIFGTNEYAEERAVMQPRTSEDIKPVDYKLLKETGEGLSNSTMVCIYKEAARQIVEENI